MADSLAKLIAGHPFFHDLREDHLALLTGCARNLVYPSKSFLFREGDNADEFFCIREGRVVLELKARSKGSIVIDTRCEGDVLGWSWIVPPYRWYCDARASSKVRAFVFDGRCLRDKFAREPEFGMAMYTRFIQLMNRMLNATRVQLLDLYGKD